MSHIWFTDELVPTLESVEQVTRSFRSAAERAAGVAEIEQKARGEVCVHQPRWTRVEDASKLATSGRAAAYYQVRLGFEFDLPREARDAGAQFVFARCEAYLWSASPSAAHPSVYELFPRDLYEGEPRVVSVELGPELKVGDASGSLGKVSSDIRLGQIEPTVVGWFGAAERAPRWELRPQSKTLLGARHLWLWIEVPRECGGARLAVCADGDIQTKVGPIPVGPKERAWDKRESVVIQ